MRRSWLLVVIGSACSDSSLDLPARADGDPAAASEPSCAPSTCPEATPPTGSDPGPTSSTPSTPTAPSLADEQRVRDWLDGRVDLTWEELLQEVAWSGGWPVPTAAGGVLVVAGPPAVALAGEATAWEPRPLQPAASGQAGWLELPGPIEPGDGYKLVLDDGTWSADPWARSFTWDAYGELSYLRRPVAIGRYDRWPGFGGRGLAPREVVVSVPAGAGPWPALYVQDGQNVFDPQAIWGGWRLGEALAEVAPLLVVAVANTPDRFDEYTHVPDDLGSGPLGGRGDDYADLITLDLRPRMDAVYGVSPRYGTLGSSLGGLISLHLAQRDPEAWQFVASLSGTLGWGSFGLSEPVMEERWLSDAALLAAASEDALLVYVDSGGGPGADGRCRDLDGDGLPEDDPDDEDNYCTNRQFADKLAEGGFEWERDLVHWHQEDAPHNEAAWAERVILPLELYATWR